MLFLLISHVHAMLLEKEEDAFTMYTATYSSNLLVHHPRAVNSLLVPTADGNS